MFCRARSFVLNKIPAKVFGGLAKMAKKWLLMQRLNEKKKYFFFNDSTQLHQKLEKTLFASYCSYQPPMPEKFIHFQIGYVVRAFASFIERLSRFHNQPQLWSIKKYCSILNDSVLVIITIRHLPFLFYARSNGHRRMLSRQVDVFEAISQWNATRTSSVGGWVPCDNFQFIQSHFIFHSYNLTGASPTTIGHIA